MIAVHAAQEHLIVFELEAVALQDLITVAYRQLVNSEILLLCLLFASTDVVVLLNFHIWINR